MRLALQFTRNAIAALNEHERLLIEVEFDATGGIADVDWSTVNLNGLTPADIERHREAGKKIVEQRLQLARSKRKIGVNEQCPCGSGKKFKRCHGWR